MIEVKEMSGEFMVSDGKHKIGMEIDYVKKTFGVYPPHGGNFFFMGMSNPSVSRAVGLLISEAAIFAEACFLARDQHNSISQG